MKVMASYKKMANILTCVPTGINTGVSTSECNNFITLDLALDKLHFAFTWKLSAVLFPIAGIFNTLHLQHNQNFLKLYNQPKIL